MKLAFILITILTFCVILVTGVVMYSTMRKKRKVPARTRKLTQFAKLQ